LTDHAALTAAAQTGRPVIPVFLCDPLVEHMGAAPKWRLGLGVAAFGKSLEAIQSRLILRRGGALEALQTLIQETGAGAVYWQRAYDPDSQTRDAKVKAALKQQGIEAKSFAGHLLFEPWTVETKQGAFYKVYTPFWKSVKDRGLGDALAPVSRLNAPDAWPHSDDLTAWGLGDAMRRGASVVALHVCVGEAAARDRLDAFIENRVADYSAARDIPGIKGTSGLSENLTYGEISALMCWHAGYRAMQQGKAGAEVFLKELVWREFAYHLLHHSPHITQSSWRPEWDRFPWNEDETTPEVTAWKQGRTGIEFVDAAMRELYVSGVMHNRARMIVGSYLTKHLLSHWRIGMNWFADTLIDWDPASNAMGWQWVAGSGPDAAPYFRVFNPVTQVEKFDRDRAYRRAWIAEGQGRPPATALSYFDAIPRAWGLSADLAYPEPVVTAEAGRKRALDAYSNRDS
jgi:deoxyribodipyrimidine photo-lyase